MSGLLLSVHLAVTWFLVGLIWIIQLVHYPTMRFVSDADFVEFENHHQVSIGRIVAPAMLLEGATAVAMWCQSSTVLQWGLRTAGLLLLLLIWFSTFVIQVPLHRRLIHGKEQVAIVSLIRTNWIRTLAWTARGLIALGM